MNSGAPPSLCKQLLGREQDCLNGGKQKEKDEAISRFSIYERTNGSVKTVPIRFTYARLKEVVALGQ